MIGERCTEFPDTHWYHIIVSLSHFLSHYSKFPLSLSPLVSLCLCESMFSGTTANLMTMDESLTYTIVEQRFVYDNPEVSFWPVSLGALIA